MADTDERALNDDLDPDEGIIEEETAPPADSEETPEGDRAAGDTGETTKDDSSTSTPMIPKPRFDEVNDRLKTAEARNQELLEMFLKRSETPETPAAAGQQEADDGLPQTEEDCASAVEWQLAQALRAERTAKAKLESQLTDMPTQIMQRIRLESEFDRCVEAAATEAGLDGVDDKTRGQLMKVVAGIGRTFEEAGTDLSIKEALKLAWPKVVGATGKPAGSNGGASALKDGLVRPSTSPVPRGSRGVRQVADTDEALHDVFRDLSAKG